MACHSAIEKKGITLSPDETVESAMKALKKKKVSTAAVIDEEGTFLGIFSLEVLIRNLIPVAVTTSNGVQIDMRISAAPGIAKRLGKVIHLNVSDVIERKPVKVLPDEPLWEAVGKLTAHGEPLCVVDERGLFMGFVTYDSLVDELENQLKSSD